MVFSIVYREYTNAANKKAVELNPECTDAYFNLANLCMVLQLGKDAMQGESDRAVKFWKKVVEMRRKSKR